MAAPFMLLTVKDSLLAWHRLGMYGTWMIGGTLIFFYAGGQRTLRKMQQEKLKDVKGEKQPGDGTMTPNGNMTLPPPIDVVMPLQK